MTSIDDDFLDDNPMIIRVVAGCFALVASLWSFCFVGALFSSKLYGPPLYLLCVTMTVGYWFRAFAHLSQAWRRSIWGLSLLIQGGFTITAIWSIFKWGLDFNPLYCMCVAWWGTTTAASALFLLGEPEDQPTEPHYP
jgi:hypothetical protein